MPCSIPKSARRAANGMITICQRYVYYNMEVNNVVTNALGSGVPISNVHAYVDMQHRSSSASGDCDRETYKIAKTTGASSIDLFRTPY